VPVSRASGCWSVSPLLTPPMLPSLRFLSDLELGELRRRLHREISGASSGVVYALSAFCVMVGDEQARRDNLPLRTGCPACLTTVRAGAQTSQERPS
jgi:hypothetical protein